jgi:NTP pyrophosphatase (non-canonical NTP hydrolase)
MPRTFEEISQINRDRSKQWHSTGSAGESNWSVSDWGVAMAGEAGEVCDAIKKLNRRRDGITMGVTRSQEELTIDIGKEIADTFLYLDLLAERLGLNMEDCIVQKFNEVSDKYGFPQKL